MLAILDDGAVLRFFGFAIKFLNLNVDIYSILFYSDLHMFSGRNNKVRAHMSILVIDEGLSSILLQTDSAKKRVEKMVIKTILDQTRFGINIPPYLKDLCKSRLKHWIDNSFLANQMQPGREYLATR